MGRFLKGSQISGELKSCIDAAENARIAVAFLKEGGYNEIRESLERALENGKSVEFVVGACPNYHITDPAVLEKLKDLEDAHRNLTLRFFGASYFHPKLFIFQKANNVKVILGSSNLTSGVISSNIEANIVLEGKKKETVINDILRFFENEILGQSSRLTRKMIKEYKSYCGRAEKATRKVKPPLWKTPKANIDWKNYPYPYRALTPSETRRIRKRIGAIAPSHWDPIRYCINLAEEYRTNSHQIRAPKAWEHYPNSHK